MVITAKDASAQISSIMSLRLRQSSSEGEADEYDPPLSAECRADLPVTLSVPAVARLPYLGLRK